MANALRNFLMFYKIGYKGFFNYRRALRFNKIIGCISDCRKKYGAGRILDVGCGTGAYCIFLKRLGCNVIGIDIDEEKMSAGKSFREPADLRHGSALDIPFGAGEFDLALMTEVLEHIKEPRKAIHEVHRVLKDGGTLVLSVPTKKYSKKFNDHDYHEKDGYDVRELAELLDGKFQIERCEQSGFFIEGAIKQLDFNLMKEKGLSYVKNSDSESLKFRLYKYFVFPLFYFILSLDNFLQSNNGLNIIAVCRKA